MNKSNLVSHVSATEGYDIRHVYSEDGSTLLGFIVKSGRGRYRIVRSDGKEREKPTLTEAFKTIKRKN